MSRPLSKEGILFYQRFLKSNGFYEGELDGIWGPKTNKADADFLAKSSSIAEQFGTFDTRSESNIMTLIPKAQIEARKFLQLCRVNSNNNEVRIISGTRTYEEQDELFAQGRTKPGKIVTNARGGQSNHNFGIAWDIGLFDNGSYNENDDDYIVLAHTVLPGLNSLEWGGNWHSFKDFPHYQLKAVSESVAAIRQLFEEGEVFV
jgi:peptidoglycan L-alanyl-D-glutamate endopeptidase CwlK